MYFIECYKSLCVLNSLNGVCKFIVRYFCEIMFWDWLSGKLYFMIYGWGFNLKDCYYLFNIFFLEKFLFNINNGLWW